MLRKIFLNKPIHIRSGFKSSTVGSTSARQLNTMSERALKNGDPLPPVSWDIMRFYNMRFCPFAQRTRIVLLHKNIPHEMVNVNLRYKPDWFLERNPLGLVPVLEYKGKVVYESRICDEYLDMLPEFGAGLLQSTDPYTRATHCILMHHFDTKVPPSIYGVLRPDKAEKAREAIAKCMNILEKALGNDLYFGGDNPGIIDFHMFPWFERFPAVTNLSRMMMDDTAAYDPLPAALYPKLYSWVHRLEQLPAVKQTMLPAEQHAEFMMKLKMRQPDYDIGLPVAAARL